MWQRSRRIHMYVVHTYRSEVTRNIALTQIFAIKTTFFINKAIAIVYYYYYLVILSAYLKALQLFSKKN